MIGLVPFGDEVPADRFTYLPQIGLCIALVVGGGRSVPLAAVSPLGVRRRSRRWRWWL